MKNSLPLWAPSSEQISQANLTGFMARVAEKHNCQLADYNEFYRWSIENPESFWEDVWEFSGLIYSQTYDTTLSDSAMPGARWFSGAKLNFAENLLRYRDDTVALVCCSEDGNSSTITYAELSRLVSKCARGLKQLGIAKGDRVAAFAPNLPETVIAMLATISLGAIWSSCSPDFGREGALARFAQIEPKVLICANGYRYHGKRHDSLARARELAAEIPNITKVIVIPYLENDLGEAPSGSLSWGDLLGGEDCPLNFEQTEFDHPVYIMYSSGTTGKPKCIVHGAGGVLLQHWKEHVLHTNLSREDTLFYFTTCGWMMWNWLISGLQVGCTILLYDGSPSYPSAETLWKLAEDKHISVFGTSPKFLSHCQDSGIVPCERFGLKALKTILSTGSPLQAENFRWVYESVKDDVQLSSISGGTDILSCFMLGNPLLPVYSEEIQCRGLGMRVEAFSDNGASLINQVGELVCTEPFPSAPVGFWNDDNQDRYREAYFERFPGVWRHGDFVEITERGGVIVYGRSDATLNPSGVRIGTAEIYNPVEALAEVSDSVVVGQRWNNDERVVLFVVLREGLQLDDDLRKVIRGAIRASATPRHVPALILQVADIPRTFSGKKVEIAVRRMIHAEEISNKEALTNPESLRYFENIPELES